MLKNEKLYAKLTQDGKIIVNVSEFEKALSVLVKKDGKWVEYKKSQLEQRVSKDGKYVILTPTTTPTTTPNAPTTPSTPKPAPAEHNTTDKQLEQISIILFEIQAQLAHLTQIVLKKNAEVNTTNTTNTTNTNDDDIVF